ncbi:MAG: hypothetical protein AABY07_05140 [Nanoarchaeota archaeon]
MNLLLAFFILIIFTFQILYFSAQEEEPPRGPEGFWIEEVDYGGKEVFIATEPSPVPLGFDSLEEWE